MRRTPSPRIPGAAKLPRQRSARDPVATALAALAHEIRTPLNGILAFGELLAAAQLGERERGWALALTAAAEYLARLTTLVVDGAKAEAQGLVLQRQPFSPGELAEEVAASLRARAQAKGLAAAVSIAAGVPERAFGDPLRLRAALENLVDNAVKFTARGRVALTVTSEAAEGRLLFTVADDGIGISAAARKRLFRPFGQAGKQVGRRFGGSGLGLSFARSVARAMGGDLTVESGGAGSTFTLSVQVEPAAAAAPDHSAGQANPPSPPRASRAGGEKAAAERGESRAVHGGGEQRALRVLCAEDNPYGRRLLETVLTALGHRVTLVGDGATAIAAVRAGGHDLVLMDLTLPGLDGLEATRRIRRLRGAHRAVPIIGLSGQGEAGGAQALAAGMNRYLAKPVSVVTLAATIAAVLEGTEQTPPL